MLSVSLKTTPASTRPEARSDWPGWFALHAATVLWASTFLVVKDTLGSVAPSLIVSARFLLAALALSPFLRRHRPALWRAGFESAIWLMLVYVTQTLGLQGSSASHGAFISALYVVIVPLSMRFAGRLVRKSEWFAACTAIIGVWLLSERSGIGAGDAWLLASAVFTAILTIRLEVHARRFSSLELSAVMVSAGAALAFVWLLIERPAVHLETIPWWSLIYLGVIVTGLSTWLMAFGQARISSAKTAVVFALEPVWAAILAFMMIRERLGFEAWFGGGLVVLANLLPRLIGSDSSLRQRSYVNGLFRRN